MYFSKRELPESVELRYFKDIQFTYCDMHYELGILIHSNNRTYLVPSFDTVDCETFFIFKRKKFYTHEIDKKERVKTPEWLKNWVIKNDYRAYY